MSTLTDSLYRFECLRSDDEVKTDLELTCVDCGETVCDVEAGDNLATLADVADDHTCTDEERELCATCSVEAHDACATPLNPACQCCHDTMRED